MYPDECLRGQGREQPGKGLALQARERTGRRDPPRERIHDQARLLPTQLGAEAAEARDELPEHESEVGERVQDEVPAETNEGAEDVYDAVEDRCVG